MGAECGVGTLRGPGRKKRAPVGDKNVDSVLGTLERLTELWCPCVHVCVRVLGLGGVLNTSGACWWWVEGSAGTDWRAQGEEQENRSSVNLWGNLGMRFHHPVCFKCWVEESGLPWWLCGKGSTCQCRRLGFDPWIRKIHPLEKNTRFSILAWEIPWTEEAGELQSLGSQKSRTWLSN